MEQNEQNERRTGFLIPTEEIKQTLGNTNRVLTQGSQALVTVQGILDDLKAITEELRAIFTRPRA